MLNIDKFRLKTQKKVLDSIYKKESFLDKKDSLDFYSIEYNGKIFFSDSNCYIYCIQSYDNYITCFLNLPKRKLNTSIETLLTDNCNKELIFHSIINTSENTLLYKFILDKETNTYIYIDKKKLDIFCLNNISNIIVKQKSDNSDISYIYIKNNISDADGVFIGVIANYRYSEV